MHLQLFYGSHVAALRHLPTLAAQVNVLTYLLSMSGLALNRL